MHIAGTRMLTDVGISGENIVIENEAGVAVKYKDLTIEIHLMWNEKRKR